jgi:accessory colonization factor AcfC
MKRFVLVLMAIGFFVSVAQAQSDTIRIYGPGGPYPVMREAAQVFSRTHNAKIIIRKGPTGHWIKEARKDADIIYSGAEFMMTDFINQLNGTVDESTVQPLYLRPSGLLVRPGNPKQIHRFTDILKPGIKVEVVNGAGQTALWEGMAGKQGNIETVKQLRKNIVHYAPNSGEAKAYWIDHPDIDVWLIWNIWQIANPTIADYVPVSRKYVLYRDCGIAMTHRGKTRPEVNAFYQFIQGDKAAAIFRKWGWMTENPKADPPSDR